MGHTNNLAERHWAELLARAREDHSSAELRLNINRSIRQAEAADLASLTQAGGAFGTRRRSGVAACEGL